MKKLILAALTVLSFSVSANASVIYDFDAYSSDGETYSQEKSFTLTVSDFITSNLSFTTADPNFVSSDYDSVFFWVDAVAQGFTETPSQTIGTAFFSGSQPYYYFYPQSLNNVGTYESIILGSDQYATLTVSERDNGTPAVPEPGTIALLGFGMAGLALYGKRRQNKA